MDLLTARKITATAARCARGLDRIGPLVEELESHDNRGDVTATESVIRTLDDLAGHYEDGRFVGGRRIAEALALCRKFPAT